MSNCQKCKSSRIMSICTSIYDECQISIGDVIYNGDIPSDLEIGENKTIEFDYCCDCGQIQGEFPLILTSIENNQIEDDDEEF